MLSRRHASPRISRGHGTFSILQIALLLACMTLSAVACQRSADTQPVSCAEQSRDFVSALTASLAAWEEGESDTLGSGGDRLAEGIRRLEDIRDEVSTMAPPDCALHVKVSMLKFMDLTIEAQYMILTDDCHTCIEEQEAQAKAAKEMALEAISTLGETP